MAERLTRDMLPPLPRKPVSYWPSRETMGWILIAQVLWRVARHFLGWF